MSPYHLACKDLEPGSDCGFYAEDQSPAELRDQYMQHGLQFHPGFRQASGEEWRRLERSVKEYLESQRRPPETRDQNVPNRTPVNVEASKKGVNPYV